MADSSTSGGNLHCKGCNLVFKIQRELDVHSLTCTRPVRGASFFQWADLRGIFPEREEQQDDSDSEKIALPSSQPNTQTPAEKNKCHLCSKSFSSDRGLKQHLRSCERKENERQMQTHTLESSQTLMSTERPEILSQNEANPSQN